MTSSKLPLIWALAVIEMLTCLAAAGEIKFAQIISATETGYVLQESYNSSNFVKDIPEDYLDGISIKPPNRYGHSMVRRGKFYGPKNQKVYDKAILFGGYHNGSRGDVWTFKAGMTNSGNNFDGDQGKFYAAEGGSIGNSAFECSRSKKTESYSHVCNSWIKNTGTLIMTKDCSSTPQSSRLEKLQVADMCVGVEVKTSVYEISVGDRVNLQLCSDAFNQRVLIEKVTKTKCSSANLLNVTSSGMCVRYRYNTKMTEWGNRSIGLCLTRYENASSSDNLRLNYCDDSLAQVFYMSRESLVAKGKAYQIQSAQGRAILCVAALQRRHPSIKGIYTLQLGQVVYLAHCDGSSPYQSIHVSNVPNECQMVQTPYEESRFDVARVYHAAGLSTSKDSILGEYYPKMLVFGGQKTMGGKSLNDIWLYDIDRSTWAPITDGLTWTHRADDHLHMNRKIQEGLKIEHLKVSHSKDLKNDTSKYSHAFDPRPKPRFGHSGTMIFHTTSSTVSKQVPILVNREFHDASYDTATRQVFDIGSIIFAEDSVILSDPTSPTKTKARQREAKLWSNAKTYGWDGRTYPFMYSYAEQGSNILNWTITLKSNYTLELKRPTIYVEQENTVVQEDNFTSTNVKLMYDYQEIHEYTCLNMTDKCRQNNLEECAFCGGTEYAQWNDGFESYKLTEWKRQTIRATAVTSGIIRMLVFGGWVTHDDGSEYMSSELWAFDYKSQLSSVGEYDADIHDTSYHTFPCCGSEQECCGTHADITFSRCVSRRKVNATGKCIGALPTMNRWTLLQTYTYGYGRPEARTDHIAVNLGGEASSAVTRDRLIVFGGQGNNGYLSDTWELSLESSPTERFDADISLFCNVSDGWIEIVLASTISDNNFTKKTNLILHNETIEHVKTSLEKIDSRIKVEIKNSSLNNASICQSGSMHFNLEMNVNFLNQFGNYSAVAITANHHSELNFTAANPVGSSITLNNSSNQTNTTWSISSASAGSNQLKIELLSAFISTYRKHTWYKTDFGISDSNKPPKRKQHAAAVTLRNKKEVVIIYGGWSGDSVLNDAWIYTPSALYGSSGSYSKLRDVGGSYKVCMPNFFKSFITIFGKSCWTLSKAESPYVYSNTLLPLSADFNSELSSEDGSHVNELLYSHGGVSKTSIPTGNNWDELGYWGGGRDPDFFGICLDENNPICKKPLYVLG